MKSFRFIHAADLHLDSPFRARLGDMPEFWRKRVRDSTFAALERIVELAVMERVQFVLFCGDIYDAADRSIRAQLRFRQALERLREAGIRAYVIHGNHDPLDGYRARLDWPDNAHFFAGDEPETVCCTDSDGEPLASISGISFRHPAERGNLAKRFPPARRDLFHIAMLHANVDGRPGHDNYAPCSLQDLIRGGYDYWALGHIHIPGILSEDPWVVYAGNPQGRSMKESGKRGVYLVQVEQNRVAEISFRETAVMLWEEVRLSLTDLSGEQELLDVLQESLDALADLSQEARLVRIVLTGDGSVPAAWRDPVFAEEILQEFQKLASSRLQQPDAPFVWPVDIAVRMELDIDRNQLANHSEFVERLLKLADEAAADGQDANPLVEQALKPLFASYAVRRLLGVPGAEERQAWLEWAKTHALQLLLAGGEEI